jgi:hypothetical protein
MCACAFCYWSAAGPARMPLSMGTYRASKRAGHATVLFLVMLAPGRGGGRSTRSLEASGGMKVREHIKAGVVFWAGEGALPPPALSSAVVF